MAKPPPAEPVMSNHITSVPGIRIGHADCDRLVSGVTVCLIDGPATASVSVMGGAPAGRDLECLASDRYVDHVDAIVLSGGSGFGLDAAGGAQAWLREAGRGFAVGNMRVPIVPEAICFDLMNGGDKDWGRFSPYRDLGYAASEAAEADSTELGSIGAGMGATTANYKGGIGSASATTSFGATVGALMVVNALGSATIGDGPHFWAGALEVGAEFGGYGLPAKPSDESHRLRWKGSDTGPAPPTATTIGIVATDATLAKPEAERIAINAHDGFARALRPAHALLDGDTLFAVSTRRRPAPANPSELVELASVAADCVARAIARGVHAATVPSPRYIGPPPFRDVHGRPDA